MALSNSLASQFAKLVTKDKKTNTETTVYGTVIEDGNNKYVKVDGSDQLIPIEDGSTVVDANANERVSVLIKDHTATVTGNVSSPAARTGDVKDVTDRVTTIEKFDLVLAERVEAQEGYIEKLQSDVAEIGDLTATTARIEALEAKDVEITGKLNASNAEITNLKTTKLDTEVANAKFATIEKLEADKATINQLIADKASIHDLEVVEASVVELDAKKLSAEQADVKYANIDFANINMAAVEELFAKSGIIKDLVVGDTAITGELVGVTIRGDLIVGNTIQADKLVVKGSDGIYYKLNIDAGATTSEKVTEEDLQNGLHGDTILAHTITAEKINVHDLVAFGALIGGFKITSDAIHSPAKTSADSSVEGIYMGSDGQFNVGNGSTYLKFFKDPDDNNKWKLEIRLAGGKSVEETIADEVDKVQIGGRNLLLNSAFKNGIAEWEIERTVSGTGCVHVDDVLDNGQQATVRLSSAGSTVTAYGKNLFDENRTYNVGEFVEDGDKVFTNYSALHEPTSTTKEYLGLSIDYVWEVARAINTTVTISFEIKSPVAGSMQIYTLGSKSFSHVTSSTRFFNLPEDEWMPYSCTLYPHYVEGDVNGERCGLSFYGTYGTGVIPYVKNIQIEIGNDVTAYEPHKEAVYTTDENGLATIDSVYSPIMTVASGIDGANLELTYPVTFSDIVTKDDKYCLDIKHLSFGETKTVYQNVSTRVQPDTEYTLSGWVLTENVVKGTTNSRLVFCTDTQEIDMPITGGSWSYISWVFTTPKDMTELRVYAYTRDMTGDVYIRDLKLEKGNRATDWTPAPEDTENDIADAKNEILAETRASLEVTEDSILSKVEGTYVTAGSFDSYKNDVSSYVDQKANELNIGFTRTTNSLEDRLDEEIDTREKHFKLSEDGLIISAGENSVRVVVDNDLICFTQSSGNTTELLTTGVELLDDSKFKKGSGIYVVSDSYAVGYGYFVIFFDDGSSAALFYDDQSAIPTVKIGTRYMYNEYGPSLAQIEERMLGYWDGDNFYAGNLVIRVDERAQFGNFAAIPRSNGNLSWLKVK